MKNLVFLIIASLFIVACGQTQEEAPPAQEVVSVEPAPVLGVLVTEEKYVPELRNAMEAMGQGDIGAFTSVMSDDVVYMFNHLDSLVGKQAVNDWWQDRFDNDLQSVSFSQNIWLSLDVEEPRYPTVQPGDYVMLWTLVTGTYSTGKTMTQFIHIVYHFNDAGKVDRVTQFVDRVPIMEANSM